MAAVAADGSTANQPPATTRPERWPVPDAAAIATADALVKEVFQDDLKKRRDAQGQSGIGREASRAGQRNQRRSGGHLREAARRTIWASLLLPALIDRAIRALATRFDVDRAAETCQAMEKMSAPSGPAANKAIADATFPIAQEFAEGEQWEAAQRLRASPLTARHASNPALFRTRHRSGRRGSLPISKSGRPRNRARIALDKDPGDPAANLALGRYLCFVRGDWERGLAHLALSSADTLKELALNSKTAPADPAAQAALGDDWWDAAEKAKGKEQDELQKGAAYWYGLAVNGMTGLAKTRVEKRLAELADEVPFRTAATASPPPTGNKPIPPTAKQAGSDARGGKQVVNERAAAEWVLQSGGKMNIVFADGKTMDVSDVAELPPQQFVLRRRRPELSQKRRRRRNRQPASLGRAGNPSPVRHEGGQRRAGPITQSTSLRTLDLGSTLAG